MQPIKRFMIRGLFGSKNIDLEIDDHALILVGPNGIGKSSVANIFYFFITRQWSRLLEYAFAEISIQIGDDEISAKREAITGLSDLRQMTREMPPSSRIRQSVEKLISAGRLEQFLSAKRFAAKDRAEFASLLEFPEQEIMFLQKNLLRRVNTSENDLFSASRLSLERRLTSAVDARVLYLPTYRRIEKELKEIFPDFEERYRAHMGSDSSVRSGRSESHFVELISFGMEDVRRALHLKKQELQNYSLGQHNNLSAIYLRDVIHGRADQYTARDINSLTDAGISEILDRVAETALSGEDKELLRHKVKSIQGKRKSDIEVHDRFLAHYFSRLVSVNADIAKRERSMKSFVDVCNGYLQPTKRMSYDELTFSVTIYDEFGDALDLSVLSSGEKQVIALFAHLYLDDVADQIVVIDEPELSLSVPWQKRFLPDIVASGRCNFVLSVTHSPFIYENALRNASVDLRRRTTAEAQRRR